MEKKPLIWLIAGTSEGRSLIKALADVEVDIIASVATEYGASIIEPQHNLKVIVGRMNLAAMEEFIEANKPDCVIDATHPYAVVVTKTVKSACDAASCRYLRLLRPESETDDCITVASYQDAVAFLNEVEGNIFLTTGSNALDLFTKVAGYQERITLRILPMMNSLEKAIALGYRPSNIICIQGPFSKELNTVMFKEALASYVITKESGSAGGFEAKKEAATAAGSKLVVIKREPECGNAFAKVLAEINKLCDKSKFIAGEEVKC